MAASTSQIRTDMSLPSAPPSLASQAVALRSGRVTSEGLVKQALGRIDELDDLLKAFVLVDRPGALSAARRADAELRSGMDRGPMHGIPYALKDIFDAEGMATTCHSRLRLDHCATLDSHVAARLREGGAILLGKLATYEFALGGPAEDLPFPSARNPWNLGRIPGGSSSGSASAVAAGLVRMATGSCTAGSIRGPAAWCGIVGLKPSFGRVSRRGVFPLSPTLDHCGPLAWSVEDVAIALGVMAGHDPLDDGSADLPVPDYCAGLDAGVAGLRVGVPRHFFVNSPLLSSEAREGIARSLELLRQGGATVQDVVLPDYELFLACNRVIMTAEAFSIHARDLRGRLPDYAAITTRRFAVGATISAADYLDALALRKTLIQAMDDVLVRHDILLTAISLDVAPEVAQAGQPLAWPLQASPFNVTGHPAMSMPVGLGHAGMPLAVQLVGRPFDEATVLRAARLLERATGWDRMRPPAPTT